MEEDLGKVITIHRKIHPNLAMNQKMKIQIQIFNHRFIFSAIYWNQVQKSDIWYLGLLVVETWNPPKITSFWHSFFPSLILLFRRNLASDKRQYNTLSGRGQERKFIRRGFGVLQPFLSATPWRDDLLHFGFANSSSCLIICGVFSFPEVNLNFWDFFWVSHEENHHYQILNIHFSWAFQ